MNTDVAKCELCGQPMPPGEEMFRYHGHSGPCPTDEKCKHCGEPIDENCETKALTYKCGSTVHTGYQSDRCLINQQKQQLATAKDGLVRILERLCVHSSEYARDCFVIANEALRQLNEKGGGE